MHVESLNSVSGSFSVDGALSQDKKPFTINVTQALSCFFHLLTCAWQVDSSRKIEPRCALPAPGEMGRRPRLLTCSLKMGNGESAGARSERSKTGYSLHRFLSDLISVICGHALRALQFDGESILNKCEASFLDVENNLRSCNCNGFESALVQRP
jgi:hypothetical protein